jgi:hypothetical protein
MKKRFAAFLTFLTSLTFVSAQYGSRLGGDLGSNLNLGVHQIIYIIESLLGPVFAIILGGYGDYFFERILFLVVTFTVIYTVISRVEPFKERKAIIWIVTIAVSLLSTRFLVESGLVQTMILPYTVLGVAITAVLPLIIYFMFVTSFKDSTNSVIRKILWIFFIVVFIGLWDSRYQDLGALSWIYFWTGVLALIFLLFDGTIQKYFIKLEREERNVDSKERHLVQLREELGEIRKQKDNFSTEGAYLRAERKAMKHIERVAKKKY